MTTDGHPEADDSSSPPCSPPAKCPRVLRGSPEPHSPAVECLCAACAEPLATDEAACALRTGVTLEVCEVFHLRCMLCSKCGRKVEETDSKCCFTAGSTRQLVCKFCQYRLRHCHRCGLYVNSDSWVHKMQDGIPFHISCFTCSACHRQLSHGEECAMHKDRLLCLDHYNEAINGRVDGVLSKCYEDSISFKHDLENSSRQKTKRVRTSFTPEQLHILQTHFEMDHNPDGGDLEKIAQSAGLNKRVTQVWFQNARARKKKTERGSSGGSGRPDSGDVVRRTSSGSGTVLHLGSPGGALCGSPSPGLSPQARLSPLSGSELHLGGILAGTYATAPVPAPPVSHEEHILRGMESCY